MLAITAVGFYFQQLSTVPNGKSVSGKGKHGFEEADTPSAVSIETVTQADSDLSKRLGHSYGTTNRDRKAAG